MKFDKVKHFSTDSVISRVALGAGKDTRPANTNYKFAKKFFDVAVSVLLLPVLAVGCLFLALANPFFNRGPMFFSQQRMGKDCKPFTAFKFRTMTCTSNIVRSAHDPLEVDRITPLGSFLRKARLDEIPQILNVLRGDMSLIGPRPDSYEHAKIYLELIPGYKERHATLPGITGQAQTEIGYVHGVEGTSIKVAADLDYISNQNFWLDTWILWRTLQIVAGRSGS